MPQGFFSSSGAAFRKTAINFRGVGSSFGGPCFLILSVTNLTALSPPLFDRSQVFFRFTMLIIVSSFSGWHHPVPALLPLSLCCVSSSTGFPRKCLIRRYVEKAGITHRVPVLSCVGGAVCRFGQYRSRTTGPADIIESREPLFRRYSPALLRIVVIVRSGFPEFSPKDGISSYST